ncbi:FGGY-family carbohydrate kinase [Paracoccus seriniphilus]|uniref:Erythritol kinase (L-erythritol 4-phosphate-forming) n=1 Tax=Paracoccus seriniphilus TaxID=184748 RepID=A0A239PTQ2_9RHOB|nr:FGGY-family carbohydrate kinase [Paracoccus seriniphilus]WCR16492.1 carbohydrate kinase [Paracoccus seriniphilus]SNT73665.1 erythritol kinase (L-erythritol 4-phosphate-forming) [Paracoccus seriniphilus]
MTDAIIIGLDAGTSVIKAVAFDPNGNQIAASSRKNSYRSLPSGAAEQDMARTWDDAAAVLSELNDQIPDLARRAVAIGVTGQGDGTWLVDHDGAPAHDAMLWVDARAAAQALALTDSASYPLIYDSTGTGVNPCQMRSQLLWMQSHAPDLLARSAAALHCKDWLYFCLTGEIATDPSEAVLNFGDMRQRDYSNEVIEACGLSGLRRLLPPIVDGACQDHGLSTQAAARTGLPAGLPVCLGAIDIMCSAMAAGLYDAELQPGLTIMGSTGVHMRFVENAATVVLNEARTGYTVGFPGQAFAQFQTNMGATVNIDWMTRIACEMLAAEGVARSPAQILAGLDEKVMAATPGRAMYHPYILPGGERGPFLDPAARASFSGLDATTGWFDMMRAVYDGLALAGRDCYQAMGGIPREIRITGGAARSTAVKTILASVLNRPVRNVAQDEAGAAGAAMTAAVRVGLFDDIGAAAAAWVTPLLRDVVQPDPALVQTYDRLFDIFQETRLAMRPVWQTQAHMREGRK